MLVHRRLPPPYRRIHRASQPTQTIAAKAAPLLAASALLDWAPSDQARSTAYSPHIDELIMYLKARAAWLCARVKGWCIGQVCSVATGEPSVYIGAGRASRPAVWLVGHAASMLPLPSPKAPADHCSGCAPTAGITVDNSGYGPHLAPTLQECASLVTRMAPAPSVDRMLRSLLRYLGDAFMLQLLSGERRCYGGHVS